MVGRKKLSTFSLKYIKPYLAPIKKTYPPLRRFGNGRSIEILPTNFKNLFLGCRLFLYGRVRVPVRVDGFSSALTKGFGGLFHILSLASRIFAINLAFEAQCGCVVVTLKS